MKMPRIRTIALALILLFAPAVYPGGGMVIERRYPDPEHPPFWKSTVDDAREAALAAQSGETRVIAVSPGGRAVYLVAYGEKPVFNRTANYNSAAAARDPGHYAGKTVDTPPIVYIVGPTHGQEMEGVVGLVNLIRVAETGSDWRGREWPKLHGLIHKTRLLIVPLANPDGRARCPYNSFVGIPGIEMTRVGQGTRADGTLYGWPGAKQRHPMTGDVGILGAYFNDAGINPMHDEWFDPMTDETRGLIGVALDEAPDCIVNLHSMENDSAILQTSYVPEYVKERIHEFSKRLHERYTAENLPSGGPSAPRPDGERYPPPSFNLTSALHHACGGVSMTFECSHGVVGEVYPTLTHSQILDTQLVLYEELLAFAHETPRPTKDGQ